MIQSTVRSTSRCFIRLVERQGTIVKTKNFEAKSLELQGQLFKERTEGQQDVARRCSRLETRECLLPLHNLLLTISISSGCNVYSVSAGLNETSAEVMELKTQLVNAQKDHAEVSRAYAEAEAAAALGKRLEVSRVSCIHLSLPLRAVQWVLPRMF